MTKQIVKIVGSPEIVSRLADVGIFPGQTVRWLGNGILRINGKITGQFTVAIRLTDTKIVVE